ncbi:formyl transferase [Mycena alexandri]|uniref:methionyl-tRNA formyltransferase n=1 Tax=Mycena alexandri TaxID=1745969 RepID=A0AAD6SQY5_9AGAR|nr:formyl transferase [Mycena alexandri]
MLSTSLCRELVSLRFNRSSWYNCRFRRHYGASTHHDRFKILFLGRDEFSCDIFQELYASKDVWQSICVATTPDTRLAHSPLNSLAQSMNVPVDFIPPEKPDFKHWKPPPPFSSPGPPQNHMLITASFGRILTPAQLELFRPACRLNVHGSVLPAYRGPAPIQHTILDNALETGVSVAQMLKRGIDKGPVWATATIPLSRDATFTSLRDALAVEGGRLLVGVLREMLAGTAKSTPQPPESPTPHAHSITINDAIVDFDTMTADEIVARHRALGHQRALTTWMPCGTRLHLYDPALATPAHIRLWDPARGPMTPGGLTYHKPARTLVIRCAQGTFLAVPRVKKEKRGTLEAREFWNGVLPNPRLVVGEELRLGGNPDAGKGSVE